MAVTRMLHLRLATLSLFACGGSTPQFAYCEPRELKDTLSEAVVGGEASAAVYWDTSASLQPLLKKGAALDGLVRDLETRILPAAGIVSFGHHAVADQVENLRLAPSKSSFRGKWSNLAGAAEVIGRSIRRTDAHDVQILISDLVVEIPASLRLTPETMICGATPPREPIAPWLFGQCFKHGFENPLWSDEDPEAPPEPATGAAPKVAIEVIELSNAQGSVFILLAGRNATAVSNVSAQLKAWSQERFEYRQAVLAPTSLRRTHVATCKTLSGGGHWSTLDSRSLSEEVKGSPPRDCRFLLNNNAEEEKLVCEVDVSSPDDQSLFSWEVLPRGVENRIATQIEGQDVALTLKRELLVNENKTHEVAIPFDVMMTVHPEAVQRLARTFRDDEDTDLLVSLLRASAEIYAEAEPIGLTVTRR